MRKRAKSVPVNRLPAEIESGIVINKVSHGSQLGLDESHSHRHDYHIFLLVEKGEIYAEIDFNTCILKTNSITYIHPTQIHRIISLERSSFYLFGITADNLNEEYFRLLEQVILPSGPLELQAGIADVLFRSILLCMEVYDRRKERLYRTVLRDQCNSFAGQCISQYMQNRERTYRSTRPEAITKSFRLLLEQKFATMNKPADYANALHISSVYLRECVRKVTGLSPSEFIQNRIVLEAKRLLYYSDKTVKEIAIALGYEDYSYFSRLFKKNAGVTALEFRNQIQKPN